MNYFVTQEQYEQLRKLAGYNPVDEIGEAFIELVSQIGNQPVSALT
jgi:hypothetical protein